MVAEKRINTIETDVAIIGGGPAGCCLAALLAANGVNAICIDREDPAKAAPSNFDGRTMAVSFGSRRVIEAADAWDHMEKSASPIRDIDILDGGGPTLLTFLSDDVEQDAFGWVIENRILRTSLYAALAAKKNVTHLAPAGVQGFSHADDYVTVHLEDGRDVRAKLVVGADGKHSFTREQMGIGTRGWDYGQKALVCIVSHTNPHNQMAIEDFRSEGPLAILPLLDDANGNHRSTIVWTEEAHTKNSAAQWDEDTFNAALRERFPASYGDVKLAGPRFSYPLTLSHAHSYIGRRMVLVADAAHAIHPIAGQGLNLGLRDVAELAELVIGAQRSGQDIGSNELLSKYQSARRPDNMAMAAATDMLNRLFSNRSGPLRHARKAGLRLVQKFPAARQFLMKNAMGASGLLPTLIRTGKF
ncbi:MAG: ubiquinone biosynthesis protein [Micavibrio aeruginosavorus]|uniref:Ubiquinone biosynthesis protein n=1 Tax=Micavibrio aeruginosavorus TaxID=349221 RepID=A0A2W5A2K9_9BACT|nr:MAG: ubiquinone biosynthesis protein [Micavibrio aeruginosavorus]